MVSHDPFGNQNQHLSQTQPQNRFAGTHEPQPTSPTPKTLNLPAIKDGLTLQERPAEAMRLAQEAFTQTSSWVEFFRETLGVDGFVRKLFTTIEEMRYFEESREYGQVAEMLTALRSQDVGKGDTLEPQRMITVRLPKSLHEFLRVQAEENELSINKLCISKLLQTVDERMVPEERGGRRGRRPGPQGPRKKKEEPVVQQYTSQQAVPTQTLQSYQQPPAPQHQPTPPRSHFG